MPANPDYRDLFSAFNAAEARFLLVGAHAVAFYAEPRYTKDLDVWVDPDPQNARRVWGALSAFGAPLTGVSPEAFSDPHTIYQIGVEPNRIDVLVGIAGLSFQEAWPNRVMSSYGGEVMAVIGRDDLIRAKRAAGRDTDLLDIRRLEAHGEGSD